MRPAPGTQRAQARGAAGVWRRLAIVGAATGGLLIGLAPAAAAHPLGNFSVNHYHGLHLHPTSLTDTAVIDAAEIPTLQAKRQVDRSGDGVVSTEERQAYAASRCSALAAAVRITAAGSRLPLDVARSSYTYRPGTANFTTSRLECELTATVDLTKPSTVAIHDDFDSAGVGWHEISATGTGVRIDNSPVPEKSISNALLDYPDDLLSSPLDVRTASLSTVPGAGASTYAGKQRIPNAGFAPRALDSLNQKLNGLVGREDLTLTVGLLGVLLALVLGAAHAALPGHGKTVMAAYLVGRHGGLRDVVIVGATVTFTHTAGVLALGLLVSVSATFVPTRALDYLGVISGLLLVGVGVGLLAAALRRRRSASGAAPPAAIQLDDGNATAEVRVAALTVAGSGPSATLAGTPEAAVAAHGHGHREPPPNGEGDGHGHPHSHGHAHPRGHSHGHGHPHAHSHGRGRLSGHDVATTRARRSTLVGLGVAGGLVPSPSALLVLLAAIPLGHPAFGVALVLCYGLGMASALVAAGLLLVHLRDRVSRSSLGRLLGGATRYVALLPVLTAVLVVVVGVALAVRSAGPLL